MKLLPLLNRVRRVVRRVVRLGPTRRPPPVRPVLPALPELIDDLAAAEDARAAGCGWYASSDELRAGLIVTELAPAGPVPRGGVRRFQAAAAT